MLTVSRFSFLLARSIVHDVVRLEDLSALAVTTESFTSIELYTVGGHFIVCIPLLTVRDVVSGRVSL